MDNAIDFIVINKDKILMEIIVTVCSAFIVFLFKKIGSIKRYIFEKILPKLDKQAKYLNTPKECFYDNCIGRYKLLKKVFKIIVGNKRNRFERKSIMITGEEGIGKTLFCYTLFRYYLKNYPVYLGWIDCNGKQSIFDIMEFTFEDSLFHRKNKEEILKIFNDMNDPCILFVDQIDQYTSIDELEELSHCNNVILVLSGTLRKINFVDYFVELPLLSDQAVSAIFEKQSGEEIIQMDTISRRSVIELLDYTRGNPFLAVEIAKAKKHYGNKWENVLKDIQTREYGDENYIKDFLSKLYKVNKLSNEQKSALSKLSIIQYAGFTESVFELLSISDSCIKSLCNLYWLEQKDSILYFLDKTHCDAVKKLFIYQINLLNAIGSINEHISENIKEKDNEFKWIYPYIEAILKEVQGYAIHIMEEEFFFEFACNVAFNYKEIKDYKKCLKWLALCKSKNTELSYKKALYEFQAKYKLLNTLYSPLEVEEAYIDALEKAKVFDDYENRKNYLLQDYCNFLCHNNQYNDAILLCKEYFGINSMDLSKIYNCHMLFRYLNAAEKLDDKTSLEKLVNETTIHALYQNEKVATSVAWSFGALGNIYKKWGDKKTSDIYMRHMVVLLNEQSGFFDSMIKLYLNISEERFMEYMHSCDELLNSLNDALHREDAEALYLEGRYQEKYGNYEDAIILYEKAATRDSLRGMCSLALLYYRGQGEPCDYDKARRYWEYCCERGHRGSHYWLGILLLDTEYSCPERDYDKDRQLALQHLTKANELGSEHAKQKLQELSKYIEVV